MLTTMDARVLDANAGALGIEMKELMRNAGSSIAKVLNDRFPGRRIDFVCGSGNNGGDGFAAALSMDPSKTRVLLLCAPSKIRSDESRYYYSLLECPIAQYAPGSLCDADVIVDCALGTGSVGTPRGTYRSFIEESQSSNKPVVSADIPSGMGTGCAVLPSVTVTFIDIKVGMTEKNSGEIIVADIGMPYEASHSVGPGDVLRYPVPDPFSHKGQNGRLMVIGGGPYYGAPIMASMAALRAGTDCVRVFCPGSVSDIVSTASPVLMVTPLPGDRLSTSSIDILLSESLNYDAVLLGPGIGTDPDTVAAVERFVAECRAPMVVDADGLTAIPGVRFETPAVLTPHRGEFEKLGGGNPEDISRLMNAVVLLKGRSDTITDGTRTRVNSTGCAAMTGAGTGDVLAGCVAGLLSKGMSTFDAACLGAFLCGKAGELAFRSRSYGLIATDVIDCIPSVLAQFLK